MQINFINNVQLPKLFSKKNKSLIQEVAENHIAQEKKNDIKYDNCKLHFVYPQGGDIAKRINKIYYHTCSDSLNEQVRQLKLKADSIEALLLSYKAREYTNELEKVITAWKKNRVSTLSVDGKMYGCIGMYYDVDNHRSTPFRVFGYKKNNTLDYIANLRGNELTLDFQDASVRDKYQKAQMRFFQNDLKEFVLVEKRDDKKIQTVFEYSDLRLKSVTQGVLDMPVVDKKIIYENGRPKKAYIGNVRTMQNGLIVADNVINCQC